MARPARIVYTVAFDFAVALFGLQRAMDLALVPGLVIGAVMSLMLLLTGRTQLDIASTFPELLRVPLLRVLVRPRRSQR